MSREGEALSQGGPPSIWVYELEGLEPLGANNAYSQNRAGVRFKTKEAKEYQETLDTLLRSQDAHRGMPLWLRPEIFLELTFLFLLPRESLFFKNGKPRKRDLSGFLKLLEDALSRHLGVDDSRHWSLHAHKVMAPEDSPPKILILLSEHRADIPLLHAGFSYAPESLRGG